LTGEVRSSHPALLRAIQNKRRNQLMGEAKELTKKKAFKMPHTLVIIFMIIFAAVLFTWVVPSGAYVRFEDAVTGRNLIDPESFHYVENTPVNPLKIMNYVIDGFMDAADLIFMLMFAGGAFHLITESGALQASIAKVARKFSNRFYIFIPMLTLIFTLIATNQGVNLFIPFVPITVMLSFALGLDSLVGVSIILLGGAVGFSTGTLQTSTTLLAQEIAGLVPFSGIWYRAICLVVFWVVTNLFLIRYAMKIKKNPQLSPMYDLDLQSEMKASTTDLSSFGELTGRRIAILAALVTLLSVAVHSVPLCVAGLCITGISYGACPTISSAFTSSFYGAKYFSLNFSVMNFNLTGASFVATAASVLLTQTGGYAAPLVLLLVLAVAALALNLNIKRP